MSKKDEIVLKVYVPTISLVKAIRFARNEKVSEAIKAIRERCSGNTNGFCLRKGESGVWMDTGELLAKYDLKPMDRVTFMKKSCKTVSVMYEMNLKQVIVDFAMSSEKVVAQICNDLGLKSPTMWAIQFASPKTKDIEWLLPGQSFLSQEITYEIAIHFRKLLQNVTVPSLAPKATIQGKLFHKEVLLDQWKVRYFVVCGSTLYLFKDTKDSAPFAFMPLDNITAKAFEDKDKNKEKRKKFTFEVSYVPPSNEVFKQPHKCSWQFAAGDDNAKHGWLEAIKNAKNAPPGAQKVFGVVISDVLACEPGQEVPWVVENSISYIISRGLDTEGILRLSGSQNEINEFKASYDRGEKPDFSSTKDPHVVSGTLKMYLRSLPEPIMTYKLYDSFLTATGVDDPRARITEIKKLVDQLPGPNRALLRRLSDLCRAVVDHSASNKMGLGNVATLMGPNLLKRENENIMDMAMDTPLVYHIAFVVIGEADFVFRDGPISEAYLKNLKPVKRIAGDDEPAEAPAAASGEPCHARALYSYAAEEAGQLPFSEGDIIMVLEANEDGWWRGKSGENEGIFPGSYVELITEEEMKLMLAQLENSAPSARRAGGERKGAMLKRQVDELEQSLRDEMERRAALDLRVAKMEAEIHSLKEMVQTLSGGSQWAAAAEQLMSVGEDTLSDLDDPLA